MRSLPRSVLRKGSITAALLLTAGLIAGCGGGSAKKNDPARNSRGSTGAHALLVQTFDGHHSIKSGVISLDLKVMPSGSSTITQPLELSFSGPFTSTGLGKLPESDFTITGSAQGQTGSLQIISADGKGYITVSGQSYEMPASSFKSVASGFGSLASSGGATGSASGTGAFAKLGIQPLAWLSGAQIVGNDTVDGVGTTHVHATVDTAAMLRSVSKLLGKAGSLGVSGASSLPSSLSSATQSRIAKALGSPSFDVWTGTSDKIVRKLTVNATIPVTGKISTLLGGMTSVSVTLVFAYSHLGQPQAITAPTTVKPYSVFQAKVGAILQAVEGGVLTGALTGTSTTGSIQPGTSTVSGIDQRYTDCITKAAGDVSKMQKCASLLGGG